MGAGEGERGSALIFTLLVLMTLSLLCTGLLTMAENEARMAYYFYRGTAAFYLAEAGLQKAAASLARNPLGREDISICWDGGGQTVVSIQEDGDYLRVVSRGEKEGVQSNLVALLRLVDHIALADTGKTIMCAGDLSIIPSADGNEFPRVEGGIVCSGEADIPERMGTSLAMEDFAFPEMIAPELYWQELGGQILTPEELAGQGNLTGFIYVDGDVVLGDEGDSIAGSAVLIITGKLTIAEAAAMEGDFVIMAAEGIELNGTTKVKGLLYTPGVFHCCSRDSGYISGKIWSGGGVHLQGEITVMEYSGDKGDLLLNLPPRLVVKKMWYREKRSYADQV